MIRFRLVASYNSVGQYGGTQHLTVAGQSKTLCNRDSSDWMDLRGAEPRDLESPWTCQRCVKKWAASPVPWSDGRP